MLKYKIRYFLFRVIRKLLYFALRIFSGKIKIEDSHRIILKYISIFRNIHTFNWYGYRIKYQLNTDIGFLLFFKGSFEENDLNVCRKFLNKNSIILDIGANIGLHSLYFSSIATNGYVYSFEPSRKTFNLLDQNLSNIKNVLPINVGLGKETQILEFLETTDNAFSSFKDTKRKPIKAKSMVLCCKLDDIIKLLNLNTINFIKIDVEGFEQEVIEGMNEVILKYKPIIFCEIYKGDNSNLNPEKTINTVYQYGYNVYVIGDNTLNEYKEHSDYFQNYLFIPKTK